MAERLHLTAVFEPVEDGWVQARVVELPEVITAGPTEAEARDLLLDALREYLLSFAQDAERLPSAPGAASAPIEITLGAS